MPPRPIKQNGWFWVQFVHPRYWLTWLGLGFLRFATLLPLPVTSLVGRFLGGMLYYLYPPRRKIAYLNISRCFPDLNKKAHCQMTKENFKATGQALFDTGIAWWAPLPRLQRLVQVQGQQHLDRALATGQPVIVLAGHFISIEISALLLSSAQDIVDIYKKPKNKLLNHIMVQRRYRFGRGSLIDYKEGIRPAIRAMRRGEILYYLADQAPSRAQSIFVPFFGIQTATLPALGRLAKIVNAEVIPCSISQLPAGKGYKVTFKPRLDNYPSSDVVQDTITMNQQVEAAVREIPTQYFWVHKRFKTRPEGELKFY